MAASRFQPGVFISGVAHAAILAWAVVSIAAPRPLEVPEVDAMPVDIVPIEELTKSIEGNLEAPLTETPAPTPTKAPPRPEPAENAGETARDVEADSPEPTPEPPVEKVEAPSEPVEQPPEPETLPEPPAPEARPEPEVAEPKTDLAALAEQAEAETEAEAEEEELELPEQVAAPKPRPEPPKPVEKKEPPKETKTALLNKAEPSAGGAKRSEKPASQGVAKANNAVKMSASEIDALRGQIQKCWNVGALAGANDAASLRAKVVFRLNRNGEIDGRPEASASGSDATTNRTFAGGARRAVQRCAPYKLPAEKYETWADVTVNFSLADML